MAKKKAKPKVQATAREKRSKPIRLDLTETEHARLLREAVKMGISMSSLVRMTMLAWLEEQEKEGEK